MSVESMQAMSSADQVVRVLETKGMNPSYAQTKCIRTLLHSFYICHYCIFPDASAEFKHVVSVKGSGCSVSQLDLTVDLCGGPFLLSQRRSLRLF